MGNLLNKIEELAELKEVIFKLNNIGNLWNFDNKSEVNHFKVDICNRLQELIRAIEIETRK